MKSDFLGWQARPRAARSYLLSGNDEGYVDFCQKVLLQRLVQMNDATLEMHTQEALLADPTPLQNQPDLFCANPGPKVVLIEESSDKASVLLDHASVTCVLTATTGTALKRLKDLHEKDPDRLFVTCYLNGGSEKKFFVDTLLKQHNVQVDTEAHAFLMQRAEEASVLLPSEVAKCALYSAGEGMLSLAAVSRCCGDPLTHDIQELITAVGLKNRPGILQQYHKSAQAGAEDIMILRMLSNHLARLLSVHEAGVQGTALDQALRGLKPPVFFKEVPAFKAQVPQWSIPMLLRALEALRIREQDIKQGSARAETAMGRFLLQLTAL